MELEMWNVSGFGGEGGCGCGYVWEEGERGMSRQCNEWSKACACTADGGEGCHEVARLCPPRCNICTVVIMIFITVCMYVYTSYNHAYDRKTINYVNLFIARSFPSTAHNQSGMAPLQPSRNMNCQLDTSMHNDDRFP